VVSTQMSGMWAGLPRIWPVLVLVFWEKLTGILWTKAT
jgi:hypothetical protein